MREAVRLLVERGDLRHPERIRRRGITLPAHAVDLIRRSLDALSEPCAELVGAGSVLGREFPRTLLEAIWDWPGSVAAHLAELARLDLVHELRAGDDPSFAFNHALTQEVAY